jgi:hypothetical protein
LFLPQFFFSLVVLCGEEEADKDKDRDRDRETDKGLEQIDR